MARTLDIDWTNHTFDATDFKGPFPSDERAGRGLDAVVSVIDDPTGAGKGKVGRFHQQASTRTADAALGNRWLWNSGITSKHGDDFWFGISIYADTNWDLGQITNNGDYFTSTYWGGFRANVGNGPGCSLQVQHRKMADGTTEPWLKSTRATKSGSTQLYFDGATDNDLLWVCKFELGKWLDIICHVRWAKAGSGIAPIREWFINGVKVASSTRPNLPDTWDTTLGIRLRWGGYWGDLVTDVRTLLMKNFRAGSSYTDVDPAIVATAPPAETAIVREDPTTVIGEQTYDTLDTVLYEERSGSPSVSGGNAVIPVGSELKTKPRFDFRNRRVELGPFTPAPITSGDIAVATGRVALITSADNNKRVVVRSVATGTPTARTHTLEVHGRGAGIDTPLILDVGTTADWYANGTKPALAIADLRAIARNRYDDFLTYTLVATGMPADMPAGAKRIAVPDQIIHPQTAKNGTVSEGMGYGMFLCALFGNPALPAGIFDPNARANFDAQWTYVRYYQAKNPRGLVPWNIDHTGVMLDDGGATDGDVDIALALVLAHRIWGSSVGSPYGAAATKLINAIRDHEFTPASYSGVGGPNVMMNGDKWGIDADRYMPDYFSPAWFREFGKHTGDARWDAIIAKNYPLAVGYFHTNFAGGLVPNQCKRDGTIIDPLKPEQYKSGYNAVRQGFRLAADVLWNGPAADPLAASMLSRAASKAKALWTTGAGVRAPEYDLDLTAGQTFANNSGRGQFGPTALIDPAHATFSAEILTAIHGDTEASYFNKGVATMAAAFMAGIARPTYALPQYAFRISPEGTQLIVESFDGETFKGIGTKDVTDQDLTNAPTKIAPGAEILSGTGTADPLLISHLRVTTPGGATAPSAIVREQAASSNTNAASLAAAPTAGRVLVTMFSSDKSAGTITAPTGFTLVDLAAGASVSFAMAYRVVAAGDSATVTWGHTTGAGMNTWVGEYSGVDTATPEVVKVTRAYDDTTSFSEAYGPTPALPAAGVAIAGLAIDSFGTNWLPAASESYATVGKFSAGAGASGLFVAEKNPVPAAAATSTTITWADTQADQSHGALLVLRAKTVAAAVPPSLTNLVGPGPDPRNPVYKWTYAGDDPKTSYRWQRISARPDAPPSEGPWSPLTATPPALTVKPGADLPIGSYTLRIEAHNAGGGPFLYEASWSVDPAPAPPAPIQVEAGDKSITMALPVLDGVPSTQIFQVYIDGLLHTSGVQVGTHELKIDGAPLANGVSSVVSIEYGPVGGPFSLRSLGQPMLPRLPAVVAAAALVATGGRSLGYVKRLDRSLRSGLRR